MNHHQHAMPIIAIPQNQNSIFDKTADRNDVVLMVVPNLERRIKHTQNAFPRLVN